MNYIPNDDDNNSVEERLRDKRSAIMRILYIAETDEVPKILKNTNEFRNKEIVVNKSIKQYSDDLKN